MHPTRFFRMPQSILNPKEPGVDGRSAESLRIDLPTGKVRLLASATATESRVPVQTGGLQLVPSSGAERLLQDSEIAQLISLARQVGTWFGGSGPAGGRRSEVVDIEFGFQSGRLILFQIRPFVDKNPATGKVYSMGRVIPAEARKQSPVALMQRPLAGVP